MRYEKRLKALLAIYADAERQLASDLRVSLATDNLARTSERRRRLADAQAVLTALGNRTDPEAAAIVEAAYGQADSAMTTTLKALNKTEPIGARFSSINRDAVVTLQESIVGRLQTARRVVGRSVEDVYAAAGRRSTMLNLLGTDGNRRKASKTLIETLTQQGKTGFVDKAGKRWSLKTYADMAARTVTRQAVADAQLLRMASHGVDLARISQHSSACRICAPWEGKIISLGGDVSEYLGEEVWSLGDLPGGSIPLHPNCKHTYTPLVREADAAMSEVNVNELAAAQQEARQIVAAARA